MATMRAIQQTEFGGPEVLEFVEVPVPEPGPGEVLVEVTRIGLNFADTHTREDTYVQAASLPLIPGAEVAGVRVDTGERVVALTGGAGGYAQFAAVRADRCFPIPDGVDDATALAVLLQGLTAWLLYDQSHVRDGETVVVISGAGGVGSLAVQLGHQLGAGRVIATASSADKRALCLELGADEATDTAAEGLGERLLAANGGAPVDVVFEMSGGEVFEQCLDALAPFGRMIAYGIASTEQNAVRTGKLLRRSLTVTGFWFGHYLEHPERAEHAIEDLFSRVAAGTLRVVVGATYPLSEARQAQIDLAARRTHGKLLLDPSA
jgi:NADPH2:quinone reductase